MNEIFDADLGILLFEAMHQFYHVRGGGNSPESDFGVRNRDDMMLFSTGPKNVLHALFQGVGVFISSAQNRRVRVSVVAETGDVYAFEEQDPCRVALLGNLGVSDRQWRERDIRERNPVFERADEAFTGWATDEDDSPSQRVSWFVERLSRD